MAGDALLHPVALVAIALLIANDHIFKQAWPGVLTGKLSDFAGLGFFPLLLHAAWEWATAIVRRPSLGGHVALAVCIVTTGAVFAAIKTVPVLGERYSDVLGWLQWLPSAVRALIGGDDPGVAHRVMLASDPTDLIALAALVAPWLIASQRRRRAIE